MMLSPFMAGVLVGVDIVVGVGAALSGQYALMALAAFGAACLISPQCLQESGHK